MKKLDKLNELESTEPEYVEVEVVKKLSTSEVDVLTSKIIDKLSAGWSNLRIVNDVIVPYYETRDTNVPENTANIIWKAKNKWISSISIPERNEYKKRQFIKSEQLQDKILSESSKDITVQSDAVHNAMKYQDRLLGIGDNEGINIQIDFAGDQTKMTEALEVDE